MAEIPYISFLDTVSEKKSFLPECLLYLALHVNGLDMYIEQIERRHNKSRLDRRAKHLVMLSVLRRELQIYCQVYSAIKERRYNDAILLIRYKVYTKEERLKYFLEMSLKNKLNYRMSKCKTFKRRGMGFEQAVGILKKMEDQVEKCWSKIINK